MRKHEHGFPIYESAMHALEAVDDKTLAKAFRMAIKYYRDGVLEEYDNSALSVVFHMLKRGIDDEREIEEARTLAAKKGHKTRNKMIPTIVDPNAKKESVKVKI